MLNYLIMRLKMGKLNYNAVIVKYPQYKSAIDSALADDYTVLGDDTVVQNEVA